MNPFYHDCGKAHPAAAVRFRRNRRRVGGRVVSIDTPSRFGDLRGTKQISNTSGWLHFPAIREAFRGGALENCPGREPEWLGSAFSRVVLRAGSFGVLSEDP